MDCESSGGGSDRTASGTPSLATEATPLVKEAPVTWAQVWTIARPYAVPQTIFLKFLVVLSLGCIILRRACNLLPPYSLKIAVDTLSKNAINHTTNAPINAVLIYVSAEIADNFLQLLQGYCDNRLNTTASAAFSSAIFSKLQALSLSYHLKRHTGETLEMIFRSAHSIQQIMDVVVFSLFPTYVHVICNSTKVGIRIR